MKLTEFLYHIRCATVSYISGYMLASRLPLGGFSWNLVLGSFTKSVEKVQIWLKPEN